MSVQQTQLSNIRTCNHPLFVRTSYVMTDSREGILDIRFMIALTFVILTAEVDFVYPINKLYLFFRLRKTNDIDLL